MNLLRRRAVIAFGLMVASFGGVAAWRPTRRLADTRPKVELESLFPKAFGEWRVDDRMPVQLISPDTQAMLNKIYNQTLSRTYVNPKGDRIMLSVAYGGDQSDATRAHRPEVCYPAQGFEILSRQDGRIEVLGRPMRVRLLVSRLGSRLEPISYWIMVGDKLTLSGTEQKLAQLAYSIGGVVPDGMLVRVSSIDPDPQRAYGLHSGFIADLGHAIQPAMRQYVMGATAG
jgi:EpsI family protein